MIRLNKYLSDAGVCSRREADCLIGAGSVTVNGCVAEVGMQIPHDACVQVDGRTVKPKKDRIYLAYHKPRGIECTFEKGKKHTLATAFSYPERVTYAGRLDKDSEGLLLMTNDGELNNRIMRARNYHEKEYVVQVDREISETFLKKMAAGIYLPELRVRTRRCTVQQVGKSEFRIVLTQGLNRQIRRMCKACGYHVTRLKRVRIMNLLLGDLRPGEYRVIEKAELEQLKKMASGEERRGSKDE